MTFPFVKAEVESNKMVFRRGSCFWVEETVTQCNESRADEGEALKTSGKLRDALQ